MNCFKRWIVFMQMVSMAMLLSAQDINTEKDVLQKAAVGIDWLTVQKPSYPDYSNREFWEGLPQKWKEEYVSKGEEFTEYTWPAVTASRYLRFMQDGNRKSMENVQNERLNALRSLVLAELVEGQGRFINPIIDGVFTMCEQTTWCNSAHLVVQKAKGSLPDVTEPIIDLGAVIVGDNLVMIHYFFKDEFDKVNPLISQRIEYEIKQRLLKPYYERDDFWWMAFRGSFVNNWNVWCNANVLKCIWLIEKNPEQRRKGILKVMRSADKFVNYYNNDGACEEGPQYWGHAGGKLYELIETLNKMSDGQYRPYTNEKVKNIARYISLVNISGSYFVNFADASPRLSSYPGLIKRIGQLIEDEKLESFAKELAITNKWESKAPKGNLGKVIPDLMLGNTWLSAEVKAAGDLSHFFDQTGICVARDQSEKSTGFFFAAKGGHNGESHNHNDVGSFIFYFNGKPFLVDAGVGTYTKKTFSSKRYEIWNMQSENHNLPLINGVGQSPGKKYKARSVKFNDNGTNVVFALNLEDAYPKQAKVSEWKRQYDYIRSEGLTITDSYQLEKCTQAAEFRFVTPLSVNEAEPGRLELVNGNDSLYLYFDAKKLEWSLNSVPELDERLGRNWPNGLKLLVLKMKRKQRKGVVKFEIKSN